jgi:hypothetical protein
MNEMQRLIGRLLEAQEEAAEEQANHRELGRGLSEAHAASQAAVVFQG